MSNNYVYFEGSNVLGQALPAGEIFELYAEAAERMPLLPPLVLETSTGTWFACLVIDHKDRAEAEATVKALQSVVHCREDAAAGKLSRSAHKCLEKLGLLKPHAP